MKKNLPILLVLLLHALLSPAQVDTTIGLDVSKGSTKDYQELAHALCDGLTGEQQKANAIYNWITHNIQYDVKAIKKKKFVTKDQAEKALKNRKAVCEGYAMLFTDMCREAGLKAVNVEGYAKDWIFDNGDQLYIPRHEWSAVVINGQWWLCDPTWGAGGLVQAPSFWRRMLNKIMRQKVGYAKRIKFKYKYDPGYFMQDPLAFRFKHLPTDPVWQLTDTTMPIALFEGGDSTIKKFNTQYPKTKQNDPELTRISGLDEKQKLFEFADRAYGFNPRFPAVLAIKQTYRADAQLDRVFSDTGVQNGLMVFTDAQNGLRESQVYIKQQKKDFPDEYAKLKKKNTVKNQETKQEIRLVKTDNKKLIADSKKYAHSAGSKDKRLGKKNADANKRMRTLDPQKISKQQESKIQKKTNSPELREIKDSVAARNKRIQDLKVELATKADVISKYQKANGGRLDTVATYLGVTDSLLVREAIARIHLHDNYDNEVIELMRQFKEIKYHKADTVMKYYLVGFDTITNLTESRQKLQVSEMDLYKKNLRSLEQYGKWNVDDSAIYIQYAACVNDYKDCIAQYNSELNSFSEYVEGNKKLFGYLGKLGRRQVKISEYMEKVEDKRKVLEEKTIAENKSFDVKENQRQEASLKNLLGKLQKIADKNLGKS